MVADPSVIACIIIDIRVRGLYISLVIFTDLLLLFDADKICEFSFDLCCHPICHYA